MLKYSTVFDETMRYYLGDEYSFIRDKNNQYKTEKLKTKAIDEYLLYLIDGYINVEIDENLERYLIQVLDEEWFHQWPVIRWAYSTRLLNSKRLSKRNITRATNILLPLAQEGYPRAMCDVADCFLCGIGVERSYEKAMCLWIASSKMGYCVAHEKLKLEFGSKCSKDIPEELRLLFLNRIFWIFIEEHNIFGENGEAEISKLSEYSLKELKKIFNELRRLDKIITQKACLRPMGELCWEDSENPYSIGTKLAL